MECRKFCNQLRHKPHYFAMTRGRKVQFCLYGGLLFTILALTRVVFIMTNTVKQTTLTITSKTIIQTATSKPSRDSKMTSTTSPKSTKTTSTSRLFRDSSGSFVPASYKLDIWVYSAYYMTSAADGARPWIRVICLASVKWDVRNIEVRPTCHLKMPSGETVTSPGRQLSVGATGPGKLRRMGLLYGNIIIECTNLTRDVIPVSVSFSWPHNHTQSTQVPVVHPDPIPKRNISVCYSVLFNQFDQTERLMQNIEFNLQMGVEHLFIYNMSVSSRVDKLLRYYTSLGVLTVLPMPDTAVVSQSWYHGQNTAIFDCHARNRFTSNWVMLQDWDEYVVPLQTRNWPTLIKEAIADEARYKPGKMVASLSFLNAFYCSTVTSGSDWDMVKKNLSLFSDDESFIHQHNVLLFTENHREGSFTRYPHRTKSMFRPDLVTEPATHRPELIAANTERAVVDLSLAYLAHHRNHRTSSKCHFDFRNFSFYKDYLTSLKKSYSELMRSTPGVTDPVQHGAIQFEAGKK